jgi:hypothetical protein
VYGGVRHVFKNAFFVFFILLLHQHDDEEHFSSADLLITVSAEKSRSRSSNAEACAAAVWRTVSKTSCSAVVVGIRPFSARQTFLMDFCLLFKRRKPNEYRKQ